jgi:hypothetical protein
MPSFIGKITPPLCRNPKILFLIDAIGALTSAVLLFFVLRHFNEIIGLPQSTLSVLSAFAAVFFLYSATCAIWLKAHFFPFLYLIATANLLYVVLTLSLLGLYWSEVTHLGLIYFFGEIALISGLAFLEITVASLLQSNN